jgi:phage head maturation protease
LGYVSRAYEDQHGLWCEFTLHNTQKAQEARAIAKERLAAGKSMGLSIGYIPLAFEERPEGVALTEVELLEVSLVSIPALSAAGVHAAKGTDANHKASWQAMEMQRLRHEHIMRMRAIACGFTVPLPPRGSAKRTLWMEMLAAKERHQLLAR